MLRRELRRTRKRRGSGEKKLEKETSPKLPGRTLKISDEEEVERGWR